MGGIAGILDYAVPPDTDQLLQLANGVGHRGPDAAGRWREGPIGLGHRRLTGHAVDVPEPHVGPRYVLMLDGRLYDGGVPNLARAWAAEARLSATIQISTPAEMAKAGQTKAA